MKILATLINLVPYHVARWNAAATVKDAEICIVQLRSQDEFAILEDSGSRADFQLITLGLKEVRVPPQVLLAAMADAFGAIRPDVVVINGYSFPISLAALKIACQRKIPVVICSESNRDDFPRRWVAETIKRRVVGLCSAGLAGATPQKAYLCDLGLPTSAVFTGYNTVDNGHFAAGADRARASASVLRAKHHLPVRYFIAVARFTEKKNIAGLIAAYAEYAGPALTAAPDLLILGDGPLRGDLEQQIARLGLESKVHLPGPIAYDLLPIYYGLATAFVHASTTEQWGLVVNEAMAAGLPVLVSNRCGCVTDLVREGENGHTFAPQDIHKLAALLGKLAAATGPEIAKMGAGSRSIISRWGPDHFAAGFEAACAKAITVGPKALQSIDNLLLNVLMKR